MLFQVLCGFEPIFYTTHPNEESTIVGIVVALGASVVGATLGLGSIYVVLCFISVILQIIITVSIGILLFAHKKIGLVLIFALAALGFIVNMVTYAITAQLGVGNIVKAIISAILMPVITYLFAKNDIANGTIA